MESTRNFARIKGLSQVRRLPRLGKIRLGIKVKKSKPDSRCKHLPTEICLYCSYPKEVDYFVCPPEVQRVYGPNPKVLDIMLPLENEEVFFPQSLKWYVSSHLKCKGNGEQAMRRAADLTEQQKKDIGPDLPANKNDLVEIPCPCPLLESGDCSQMGNLMVLLPKVSMSGVYQIDSGSYNNIVRINSSIDYTRSLLGRIALVPLLLKRNPEVIEHDGKKQTHYLLALEFAGNIDTVNQLRQNTQMVLKSVETLALAAPVETGPEPSGEPPIEAEQSPAFNQAKAVSEEMKGIDTIGPAGQKEALEIARARGVTPAALLIYANKTYGVKKIEDLPFERYDELVGWINNQAKK